MKTKASLKPSKPLSAGAVASLVFMLFFGIGFFVLVSSVLFENEAPVIMHIVFYIFMLGWIGMVIFMLGYHWLNLKRSRGLSLMNIETESGSEENFSEKDPMQKLRSLEELKKDGLITEDEYRIKRAEIMQQKW